jgi:hypothetical protein
MFWRVSRIRRTRTPTAAPCGIGGHPTERLTQHFVPVLADRFYSVFLN